MAALDRAGWRGAVTVAAVLGMAGAATAEESPLTAKATRPWRGGLEAGGYAALTGPIDRALALAAVVEPGGAFARYGLAARAFVDEDGEAAAVLVGITFEPAASRPRLALSLHAEAGLTVGDGLGASRPVWGGGVTSYLWPVTAARPLGLAFDGTAHLYYDGVDSRLALGGSVRLIVRN